MQSNGGKNGMSGMMLSPKVKQAASDPEPAAEVNITNAFNSGRYP